MFFATDVGYDDATDRATAAAVGFWTSSDDAPVRRFVETVEGVAPYEPGFFYKRELPCVLAVLERAAAVESVDLVIVDGHAWLGEGQPGLGHHLWEALGRRIPVFGVAKAPFVDGVALPVTRGDSDRPLWVSAVGVDPQKAADFVARMHGPYRIPTLLTLADHLSRGR